MRRFRITSPLSGALAVAADMYGVTRNELIESWLSQIMLVCLPKIVAQMDTTGSIAMAANYKPDLEIEVKFPNAP